MISLDHALEIALLLLVSYLCGCVIGYGLHIAVRRVTAHAVATPVPQSTPLAMPSGARRLAGIAERDPVVLSPAPMQMQRPPELPAPRKGKPDDLRKIKGIGAKTEAALHDLGIYHYDQIAAWHASHLDWLEGRIAVKGRIRREQWVEQAVLLATEIAPMSDVPAEAG